MQSFDKLNCLLIGLRVLSFIFGTIYKKMTLVGYNYPTFLVNYNSKRCTRDQFTENQHHSLCGDKPLINVNDCFIIQFVFTVH